VLKYRPMYTIFMGALSPKVKLFLRACQSLLILFRFNYKLYRLFPTLLQNWEIDRGKKYTGSMWKPQINSVIKDLF